VCAIMKKDNIKKKCYRKKKGTSNGVYIKDGERAIECMRSGYFVLLPLFPDAADFLVSSVRVRRLDTSLLVASVDNLCNSL
jgi:hypothetical protein